MSEFPKAENDAIWELWMNIGHIGPHDKYQVERAFPYAITKFVAALRTTHDIVPKSAGRKEAARDG